PPSGEPRSSCSKIHEGVLSSWASCNPAEYFPGYLTKLLQNHTAYACDGDHLDLQCPRHSTISVQSAFYGQDYQTCSAQQPASQREDSLTCVAPTTLQGLIRLGAGRAAAQHWPTCDPVLGVPRASTEQTHSPRRCWTNARTSGPATSWSIAVFLDLTFVQEAVNTSWSPLNANLVSNLRGAQRVQGALPMEGDELKNKTVCEDHELKLHCHESKFLNIYSATYGRKTQERDVCSSEATWLPPFGMCLYVAVLRVLSEEIRAPVPKEATRWLVPGLEGKSRAGGNHPPGSCLPLPHILE
ncbi:hypothetical protein E2I00_001460, partial [Balaenoptera physalus]